jgi:hypothetical protein
MNGKSYILTGSEDCSIMVLTDDGHEGGNFVSVAQIAKHGSVVLGLATVDLGFLVFDDANDLDDSNTLLFSCGGCEEIYATTINAGKDDRLTLTDSGIAPKLWYNSALN